ncbi:MAG: T9SS type A sorting domain-containing protein [Candidatus Electryonea clarkiae]|nr:T9SS type A sorting domain-containing protein [Candidatus Electryonea clarkiae]MDP8286881.1 T9SS type A sorting domain-containing protein [Candidatus Electryonea clarkiae]
MRIMSLLLLLFFPVVSTAQDSLNLSVVSRMYDLWGTVFDMEMDSSYLYLSTGQSGLKIVEITEQGELEVVGELNINIFNAALLGDALYVASYDFPDYGTGIYIVDISDRSDPVIDQTLYRSYYWFEPLSIHNDFLFTGSYPLDPMYLDFGITVYEISDPLNPDSVGHIWTEDVLLDFGFNDSVFVVLDYHGIYTYSLSEGNFLEELGESRAIDSVQISRTSNFDVTGNHVYITGPRFFSTVDIVDPVNPEIIGGDYTLDFYDDVVVNGAAAYVTDSLGLHTYDISDPANLQLENSLETGIPSAQLGVKDPILYLGHGNGLSLYSITDQFEPTLIDTFIRGGRIRNLFGSDSMIFVRIDYGLRLVNISNPEMPIETGRIETPVDACQKVGNRLYLSSIMNNQHQQDNLSVYDISNPSSPELIGELQEFPRNIQFFVRDSLVYLGYYNGNNGNSYLMIYDFQNASDPDEIYSYTFESIFINWITMDYPKIYAAGYDTIYTFDFSDLERPVLITGDTPYGISGGKVYCYDDHIYRLSSPESITVLDMTDPSDISSSTVVYFEFNECRYFAGYQNFLAYSISDEVLKVLDLSNPDSIVEYGYYEGFDGYLAFANDHLALAETHRLYLFDLDWEFSVSASETFIPSTFSLSEIYPNPFNNTTTVKIGLPQSAEIEVSAFNILGQKVAHLASGRYDSGYHNIVFDASGNSSGIYFIHANVPGKMNEVKKVVLLR